MHRAGSLRLCVFSEASHCVLSSHPLELVSVTCLVVRFHPRSRFTCSNKQCESNDCDCDSDCDLLSRPSPTTTVWTLGMNVLVCQRNAPFTTSVEFLVSLLHEQSRACVVCGASSKCRQAAVQPG